MILKKEASLEVLIAEACTEVFLIKRFKRLITLCQQVEDIETIYLLLECYESSFDCWFEEIEYSLQLAQTKIEQLPEDFR